MTAKDFKSIAMSLSVENGCLFYGARIVIPSTLQRQVLEILHMGHFGMQRMKQLARSAVYWPRIDKDIMEACRQCSSCAEHQNLPPKETNHPWMLPEKPWTRIHIDHAINFMGSNWLVVVDSYSRYPCIHQTYSTSSKATMELLDQDFSHFGYPQTIVSDNASTFTSYEFQEWCKSRGIIHLTGAPFHPATNGAAERLVQSFKKALKKSSLPPKQALQEFLIQYRRTPLASGLSPSELLNGRQIRAKIDILLPSPAHTAQQRQMRTNSQNDKTTTTKVDRKYKVGTLCYALSYSNNRNRKPRWVPAIVTKVSGTRNISVKVLPHGPIWRRHIEQIRPRYTTDENNGPDIIVTDTNDENTSNDELVHEVLADASETSQVNEDEVPHQQGLLDRPIEQQEIVIQTPEYGPHNPRRSDRNRRSPNRLNLRVKEF